MVISGDLTLREELRTFSGDLTLRHELWSSLVI